MKHSLKLKPTVREFDEKGSQTEAYSMGILTRNLGKMKSIKKEFHEKLVQTKTNST